MIKNQPLVIAGETIHPGERKTIELPTANLYTHTTLTIPTHVIHGKQAGPTLFVIAAIHGDELNGIEVIRRLLRHKKLQAMKGTLIAIPIINIYGFINLSRYLPDRRDLNRVFPGSKKGSLASRLAHLLMSEVISKCTHGIDLHTGSGHRNNLPQIRVDCRDKESVRLAKKFGTSLVINADIRDGSLRESCEDLGIPTLLYEAGEALRFDETSIQLGVQGVLRVMDALKMLPLPADTPAVTKPVISYSTGWVRAPQSGLLHSQCQLGQRVRKGESLGIVTDPFGEKQARINASRSGAIIGITNLPIINEGDAIFHIASLRSKKGAEPLALPGNFHQIVNPEEYRDEHTIHDNPKRSE